MVGCRMQQACGARAEKAVEVGRNDRDGTSREVAALGRRKRRSTRSRGPRINREWTLEADVDEGAVFGQPHERSPNRRFAKRPGTPGIAEGIEGRTARCVTRLRRGREGHEGPPRLGSPERDVTRSGKHLEGTGSERLGASERKAREVERGRPTTRDPDPDERAATPTSVDTNGERGP
jgi:hypothetical protein